MQRIKKTYRSKTIHRVEKMYHTEKYQLNLIEPSDPFLPDALNDNTQKVEDAMLAHHAEVSGDLSALDQRVVTLEAHKIAYGSYTGNDKRDRFISLPFAPRYLLLVCISGIAAATHDGDPAPNYPIKLDGAGFTIFSISDFNMNGRIYTYFAFL